MKSEFTERANQLPILGAGLSVDVYSPDVLQLVRALGEAGLRPGYLEVFKATTSAMQWVRRQLPGVPLTYHGEGLWTTQPDFPQSPSGRQGVAEACAQLAALNSAWLNHECATKQMAGYAVGTYLPPLYTELSARMTAENITFLQAQVDARARQDGVDPALVLLEMSPLTYFGCGAITIPRFFRLVTEQAACGVVLDIGHLWTVYRYTGAWRKQRVEDFVAEFLDEFPMERVIEIHVAGLAEFPASGDRVSTVEEGDRPYWIDTHGAPIPPLLFEMLAQVLAHPRLRWVKGVALEVDTKPIAMIVEEYGRFVTRFDRSIAEVQRQGLAASLAASPSETTPPVHVQRPLTAEQRMELQEQYRAYVQHVAIGTSLPMMGELSLLGGSGDDLIRYRTTYLPHELLHWGGELQDMFPKTCGLLAAAQVSLEQFVPVWFSQPRPEQDDYDFFLLKIDRFVEFVEQLCPSAATCVNTEAQELRDAYCAANEPIESVGGRV
ncbi:MAG: DUF692 family protein [Nitrospira sp.]|nr:DUF692 family protein [Nitrospira sp.]